MPAKLSTQNKYHMLCEIEAITARAQVPALRLVSIWITPAAVGRAFMPAKLSTQNKYHMLCEIEGITARAQVPALRKETHTNLPNTTTAQQVPRACCDKRSHGWRSARLGADRPVEGKAACTRYGMRRYYGHRHYGYMRILQPRTLDACASPVVKQTQRHTGLLHST